MFARKKLFNAVTLVVLVVGLLMVFAPAVYAYPEWEEWVYYNVGDRVEYNGRDYECRQAHTSQPDWTPPAVPALWEDLGPSGGATDTPVPPTDTPAPTNTSAPTNTPTSGPSATPTATSAAPTATPSGDWTVLTYDDFESGWGNYTDGGGDCSRYTGGTYAHQGNAAADIQDNSGTSSSFYYTDGRDVHSPGYTQIKVEFWFYAVSMESGEDFWVQYYDGSTWRTVASYARGTDFNNGAFYDETVYIDESSYTFPTSMKIRFRCDASGNSDDVYIDEVRVSAKGGAPAPTATPTSAATATPTSAATATPTSAATATSTPSGACTAPAWNPSTVYYNGDIVSYNSHEWKAKWWTQGETPGVADVWEDLGPCTEATATPTSTPGPTATPGPTSPPGGKIVGYFVQWGVYARNYHVKNIVTSGSASKLTHINYAFANVNSSGQCVIGDAYADYDKFYGAAASVDGTSDCWDAGCLRGNFHQLQELKALYPNIKVLLSVGGWTWSGNFGAAAQNPTAFANSCYNLIHDSRWDGVFDGIDIDWEYPNACGLTCDYSGPEAFEDLMQALRSRFGSELVTAAVPAGYDKINASDYAGAAQYVDWYNIMTYDFFGAWDADGPTAYHSPLYSWAEIPAANYYADYAVQLYKSKGVSSSKLVLGVPFYGRGWTGVGSGNNGLGQSASGPAQGTYEQGIDDYKVVKNASGSIYYGAGTLHKYGGSTFWTYDNPSTLASKQSYRKNQGMSGVMFWELSGDTTNGELITALYNNR